MRRLGLDTSVVMRILTSEPDDLYQVARDRILSELDKGTKLVVADVVLLEAYFSLQSSYGFQKSDAIRTLEAFLHAGIVETEPGSILKSDIFRATSKAGFGDRLIAHRYGQCADGFLTFDKAMTRLSGAHPVASSKES